MKRLLIPLVCLCLVTGTEAAKLKVRAEPDPAFDFATLRSWAWDTDPGDVIMARTASQGRAAHKQPIAPLIRQSVETAFTKKGLPLAAGGAADVQLHYYVLVSVNASGQSMGQFLPAVAYWGLPPFASSTTSLKIVTQGSLVLDALLPG